MAELITGVALLTEQGALHQLDAPNRHWNVIQLMVSLGLDGDVPDACQGFVTSQGRFVDRREALAIALESRQVREDQRPVPGLPELFSEDLW